MATRFQHYVPQVYLRAWETTKGVYYFTKNNLSVGERRNTNSILAEYHTYTIDYEHSFVFNEMPEIATDFGNKIIEILNKQNALAFYKEKRLETIEELTSVEVFPFLEDWEFYKQDNPEFLARKNSIVREIKDIHSYVIENKLDDFLEKEWGKTRDEFIQAIEKVSGYTTMEDVKIDETLAIKMLYSVLLLMCRNPVFDCLGIFPKIENVFTDMFSINELCEEEKKKSKKVIDQQLHAAWLGEIYRGLFQNKKGFCKIYAEHMQKRCQLVLLRCPEENGSFITSDNPAFIFMNKVMRQNRNGFYIPLTPQYLLLIGKGRDNIGSVDVHTITNQGVKFYNNIILSKATNAIVSNKKYLGYIL